MELPTILAIIVTIMVMMPITITRLYNYNIKGVWKRWITGKKLNMMRTGQKF
jgi:hypothetical protein